MSIRIEDTQIVKAAREEVFGNWTDCEGWPTWLPVFTRVDVTQRGGNVVRLSLDMKVKGLTLKRTETHVLTPPEKVEVEGAIRGVTNTTLWTFLEVPDGTRVSAVVDAEVRPWLKPLEPLVRAQLRTALRDSLDAFAEYVERP
jgi:ribosome-associated toxin RatA of RatAB toxin-antitoxin module